MYQHILVPLDTTSSDAAILAHIRPLAKLCGARITLIHVADGFMARNQKTLDLGDSPEMTKDRGYLEQRRQALVADGFAAEAVLALGDPTDQILLIAAQRGCDLIAMATHGHRFPTDLILGSVAHELRHRTLLPVLLLQAPQK